MNATKRALAQKIVDQKLVVEQLAKALEAERGKLHQMVAEFDQIERLEKADKRARRPLTETQKRLLIHVHYGHSRLTCAYGRFRDNFEYVAKDTARRLLDDGYIALMIGPLEEKDGHWWNDKWNTFESARSYVVTDKGAKAAQDEMKRWIGHHGRPMMEKTWGPLDF